jgi:glutamyl-tRNA reductase
MVDLAVPRDIEPEVATLDDVYLYSVDDLQAVIDENLQSRMQAAAQARDIIQAEVVRFLDWQRSLAAVDIISELRSASQQMSQQVLEKALKQLATGQSAEQALEFLAHTLTNKFLHQPTIRLRQASQNDQQHILHTARQLFFDASTGAEDSAVDGDAGPKA